MGLLVNRIFIYALAGSIMIGVASSGALYLQLHFARADLAAAIAEKKLEKTRADSFSAALGQCQIREKALQNYKKRSAQIAKWQTETSRTIEQAAMPAMEAASNETMVDIWNGIVDAFTFGLRPSATIANPTDSPH